MRLGARNSGNSIQPWAARRLADAPRTQLERALHAAKARQRILLTTGDCATRRILLAREDWLIRCLGEALARETGG